MKYFLIKFSDNWADEMDIRGFETFTESEYNEYISQLDKIEYPVEVGIGTNESLEYLSKEDYLRKLTVVEIEQSELDTLNKLFGPYERGKFVDLSEYAEFDDEDFDDDE